eukprot:SAG22_NODE_296_length_12811_cov_14.899780_7_plen_31_part_00
MSGPSGLPVAAGQTGTTMADDYEGKISDLE